MSHVKFCCTCEVYEEPATVPVPFKTHIWLNGRYRKIYQSLKVVNAVEPYPTPPPPRALQL